MQFFENQENIRIIERLKQQGVQLQSGEETALLSEKLIGKILLYQMFLKFIQEMN